MPKPDQGLVFDGYSSANGEYVVLELSAVLSNDASVDREALDKFAEAQGNSEYQSVLKLLTSSADVNRTPAEDL